MDYFGHRIDVDNNHRLYLGGVLALGILLIILSLTISRERTSSYGRASSGTVGNAEAVISSENSYIFISPVSAEANGKSIVRITVFLLNSQGMGVAGQKVTVKIPGQVNINEVSPTTDTFGRAIFDVTSTNSGDYTISASGGGVPLPQTASVSFH